MSVAARVQRRRFGFPWAAAAGILAAAAITTTVVVAVGSRSGSTPAPRERVVTVARDQAPWQITLGAKVMGRSAKGAGGAGISAERSAIAASVAEVYDAVFLDGDVDSALTSHFTPEAARRLAASDIGWPEDATRISLRKRKARVALQFDSGRRGVATVKIAGRALVDGERMRIFHRSTLWLEKSEGRWTIIAFDATQFPVR